MSTLIIAFAALHSAPKAVVWYGPATVSFHTSTSGNPYDSDQNDAWVVFKGRNGSEEKRLAYFDDGDWKSVLVAPQPGEYTATLTINGKALGPAKKVAATATIDEGFVRKGGRWGFTYDNGKLYWPMGHNLGWQSPGLPDLPDFIGTMAKNGINWTRIWACTWDGKNPWWPSDKTKLDIGMYWPKALKRWDTIVDAADKADVRFQFTLFHHGEWSSTTDPNWPDNPWNTKNGGFLSDPVDFFTNARAKKLAKQWIRYAIARWGYSRSIMAWELFNEVQWVDAVKKNHTADVGAWHDEMAQYVRTLDPYHHLITTSSEMSLPIWNQVDYYQPHGYPARIEPMVLSAKSPDTKPLFFGEVGPGQLNGVKEVQVQAVRDGIWSGLIARHSGAAEYWSWDLTLKDDLHREYAMARKILNDSGILNEDGLKDAAIDLDAGVGGNLKFAPGGGWEPTTQFVYHLPDDAGASMSHFSAYFQGKGHTEMRPRPVQFTFNAPSAGTAVIAVSGISDGGGELTVALNGAVVSRKAWKGGTKFSAPEKIEVPFEAGSVKIELDNAGPDWVQLSSISIPGIARGASAVGMGNTRETIMRIERPAGIPMASIQPGGLTLADGAYRGTLTDLATGTETPLKVTVSGGRMTSRLDLTSIDSILWLQKSK